MMVEEKNLKLFDNWSTIDYRLGPISFAPVVQLAGHLTGPVFFLYKTDTRAIYRTFGP